MGGFPFTLSICLRTLWLSLYYISYIWWSYRSHFSAIIQKSPIKPWLVGSQTDIAPPPPVWLLQIVNLMEMQRIVCWIKTMFISCFVSLVQLKTENTPERFNTLCVYEKRFPREFALIKMDNNHLINCFCGLFFRIRRRRRKYLFFATLNQNMIVNAINEVLYLGSYFYTYWIFLHVLQLIVAEVVTP